MFTSVIKLDPFPFANSPSEGSQSKNTTHRLGPNLLLKTPLLLEGYRIARIYDLSEDLKTVRRLKFIRFSSALLRAGRLGRKTGM